MIQEVFSIGSFSVSPFGLMLVAALLSAYDQLRRGMLHLRIGDEDDASLVVFACGVCGIAGGKIYYAILVGDPQMLLDRAGIVWYGCLIGGFLAFLVVARIRNLPMLRTLDAVAPGLALGYGVGRIGCLLVGDDYGVPTDLPWGMTFPVGLPPTTAAGLRSFGVDVPASIPDGQLLAVHPTQIYSSLAAFAIFALAFHLLRHRLPRPGVLFLDVLALLSMERFLVEFLRAKDDRFFGMFTLAQVISVTILILIALTYARIGRKDEAGARA